jgi:hypothetical protein
MRLLAHLETVNEGRVTAPAADLVHQHEPQHEQEHEQEHERAMNSMNAPRNVRATA